MIFVSSGLGLALDPNTASVAELELAARRLIDGDSASAAADLGASLRAIPIVRVRTDRMPSRCICRLRSMRSLEFSGAGSPTG